MRLAYGEGVIVAILAPFIVLLFGKITVLQTFFAVFLLLGLWTLVSAFLLMALKDRIYYITWGMILSCLSTAFIIHIQYAIALILIAIIAALLINVATRKNPPKTQGVKVDQSNAGKPS
ncbi:MAG TPA: hypothetical protein VED17_06240 [Nitrososphaerales archaeon]|nr:hypothetical protein [Nitrososphaerales archaeon]